MNILVEENHDLPIVRLTATLLTGASDDPVGREGLACFATDLACRGAAGRTREEIDEAFERLGGDLAVAADSDTVTFDVEVLSAHLEPALALLADVLLRPDWNALEADQLRREMHASLDDLRDDDGQLARRFFGRQLYGSHPYGKPAGGTTASINRLTPHEARAFMERALTSGNLILSAAGDVAPAHFRQLISRRFGVLRHDAPTHPILPVAAFPSGLRLQLVDKPERTQSQLLFGHPAIRRADPDFLPLAVAASAFGGTFTSRLMREVRVKRGLSYGASCGVSQGRSPRAITMRMAPSIDQTVETIALVLDLWKQFVEDGLTEEEIEFSKEHLAAGFAFQLVTPEDRVDLRAGIEICGLPPDFLSRLVPDIRAVTPAHVKQVIRRVLRKDDLAITVLSTASELLPALLKAKLLPKRAIEVVGFDSY